MITMTLDDKKVIAALKLMPDKLEDALNKSLTDVFYHMAVEARNSHRYKVRTGNLRSATRSAVKELTAELFVDDVKAYYGVYVHEGHHNGAWPPDQFVYDAFKRGEPRLMEAIDRTVDKVIKDAGF